MWRPFKRGFIAVRSFKRQWFRRSRVEAIDAESDVGSVAASVDRCNRCECPCSCACYCHTTGIISPSPSQNPPQGPSPNSVSSGNSTQERANQELAEADNRITDSSRPCTLPPASDYGAVQSSQQDNGILFGSPRASSYLSYVTVAIQRHPSPDGGREESPIDLPSDTSSTRLSPHPYGRWGVVPLPSATPPPHPAVQTPVEDDVAPAGAWSHRTTTDNLVGTGTTNRSSVATATTIVASLIEGTEDLLNFPEVEGGLHNELFSPVPPPTGPSQQNVSPASTSRVMNHNDPSSGPSLSNVPLPTGYSARLGVYTNPNRANLDPLEFPGGALSCAQAHNYNTGANNALGNRQTASSTELHAAGHSGRPDASEAMREAGGYSASGSQSIRQPVLGYPSTIRYNMVLEVTRLGLHLDSVIDHYIQRAMAGTTRNWSVGRRPQRQAVIGLLRLQRLVEKMRKHAFSVSGAQVFAIVEVLSTFEGDLNRLTTSLDRSSSGPGDSLFFTLLCMALPEDLNQLYRDYEERFRRIKAFFFP